MFHRVDFLQMAEMRKRVASRRKQGAAGDAATDESSGGTPKLGPAGVSAAAPPALSLVPAGLPPRVAALVGALHLVPRSTLSTGRLAELVSVDGR